MLVFQAEDVYRLLAIQSVFPEWIICTVTIYLVYVKCSCSWGAVIPGTIFYTSFPPTGLFIQCSFLNDFILIPLN